MKREGFRRRRTLLGIVAPVAAAVVVAAVVSVLVLRPDHTKSASPTSTPALSANLSGFPDYAATVIGPSIDVHASPDPAAPVVVHLGHVDENGAPQTFLIETQGPGRDGKPWFLVLLPIRPNGSKGWIRASDVETRGLRFDLAIHLRSFNLDLVQDGKLILKIPIGVGTQNTPTPAGRYYVKELIKPPNQNTIYGHYVLGLNGFSNVLKNWPGGGVLGIHGTNDLHSIGRRVSHGCIRMSNSNIELLARILPLGTPVKVLDD